MAISYGARHDKTKYLKIMLNREDLAQLAQRGISEAEFNCQLERFREGFAFTHLVRPATKGDGIMVFDLRKIDELLDGYESAIREREIVKFVPASGAATRMFKALFEYRETAKNNALTEKMQDEKDSNGVHYLMHHLHEVAFYEDLFKVMEKHQVDLKDCLEKHDYVSIIDFILDEKGLNYANLCKGLLLFHHYKNAESRTALEEHLVEAAGYCNVNGKAKLHFTVSPEHLEKFTNKVNEKLPYYEEKFQIKYDISYSIQKPSTDTIAVDMNNNPVHDDKGNLMFRPGGHGALIENLKDLKGDIIFVKNIDNVAPDHLKTPTFTYKKVIGGYLLELQKNIFEYLNILEKGELDEVKLQEIYGFLFHQLQCNIKNFEKLSTKDKQQALFDHLNRPIRICGMVKNEGEPGGGPFWVENAHHESSLQIVESSQVDTKNEEQKYALQHATHFNPVDLVCGVRNYKGEVFDLQKYVDPQTCFISSKSIGSLSIKALELPGLWNGAMADWITVFVEVPIAVFSPVKTVNDFLRREHQ